MCVRPGHIMPNSINVPLVCAASQKCSMQRASLLRAQWMH